MSSQETLDMLLDALFTEAIDRLRQNGHFAPFSAMSTIDGIIEAIPLDLADDEPTAEQMMQIVANKLQMAVSSGQCQALGVCADMIITDPRSGEETSAIMAMLEHPEPRCVDVYLPYTRDAESEDIELGEHFAVPGTAMVWGVGEAEQTD